MEPVPETAVAPAAPKEREVAFQFQDPLLAEDFPIMHSANAWWMKAGKLGQFVNGLKTHFYIKDAMSLAGISMDQWRYFLEIHPDFYPLVELFQNASTILARHNIGLAISARHADGSPDLATRLKTSRWLVERTDARFRRQPGGFDPALPPGGSALTTFTQTFRDEKGNLIMSRKAAELLEHGNNLGTA